MTDLLKLAEFMEELSSTSGDHHMQAAQAIRRLNNLEKVASDVLQASAELSELWHETVAAHPETGSERFSVTLAVEKVDEAVRAL